MKDLLRSPVIQDVLAWLVWAYISLTMATMRWRIENFDAGRAAREEAPGGIVLFWHGRIAFAMVARKAMGAKPKRVMISLSRDGEFIAKAAERLGAPAIRGSTGRAGRSMVKGGAAAFRQALAFIESGGAVVMTPDGPRGPNQVLPLGPVQLAKMADCVVFIGGLAGRPAMAFDSWDKARLPLPFSRGCLVVEGPLRVAPDADDDQLEATRERWQALMRETQRKAEVILEGGG
jgi:lysophospholipid acyltransferase (LPLAT)-like uncharacterized protein